VHMNRLVAAATLAAVLLLQTGNVSAQAATTAKSGERVDGDIKGTVGLGLIGMEVGLLLPPILKLHDQAWAWAVFPIAGAAAGAVGGFFAFEGNDPNPKVTVPILAIGIGLVIPAVVGSLAIKSRREAADMEQGYDDGTGLVRFNRKGTFVRAPALAVGSRYNTTDQLRYGVASQRATTLHVPLFSGRF